jgi:hypothetical protein
MPDRKIGKRSPDGQDNTASRAAATTLPRPRESQRKYVQICPRRSMHLFNSKTQLFYFGSRKETAPHISGTSILVDFGIPRQSRNGGHAAVLR